MLYYISSNAINDINILEIVNNKGETYVYYYYCEYFTFQSFSTQRSSREKISHGKDLLQIFGKSEITSSVTLQKVFYKALTLEIT